MVLRVSAPKHSHDMVMHLRRSAWSARFVPVIVALSMYCCALAIGAGEVRAAEGAFPPPVVVVYPFTVSGASSSAATQAGGNIALLLSNRLSELGGVTVKPFTPGTDRTAFLTAAQKQNADYYVTGFLTPIGTEASLITQVVSTYGGTVIWSNSVTIRTYADAVAEADPLRAAIVAHAQRSLSSISAQAPAPAAAETAAPDSHDAAGVNLTKALGRHHRGAPPSPAPSTSPAGVAVAAAPVERGALVANVAGSSDATLRAYAAKALANALKHDRVERGGVIAASPQDAIAHAGDLCRANAGTQAIYLGTLAPGPAPASVTLGVTAYDCAGKLLGTHADTETTGRRVTPEQAVDLAAAKAIDAFETTPAVSR